VSNLAPTHFALTGGRIVLPTTIVTDHALVIDAGCIAGLVVPEALPPALPKIDVGGRLIAPGLIDIHIHGAVNHSFNDATPAAFAAITQETARRGITSLLATTATDSIENLLAALDLVERWMAASQTGSQLLGVHVEGPYFSMAQRGAQDPAHIRNPDDGSVEQLLEYRDTIRIMTYAPELPGALALTRRLAELGIVAAAGHSSAREEDVKPAIAAGLCHCIHLWSGQSTTIR
jgi:N-acetylglucosamine-6-phosphate deacetylase